MSRTFYRQLHQLLQQQAVVVATVVRTRGSTPREVGAKMLIPETGNPIDTIGGGAGEAKVCQQARSVLQTGKNQFVEIDLSGASQRPVEGVCGGWMQVWLERWSGEAAIDLAQQIVQQLQVGQPGILVTPLTAERSSYLVSSLPEVTTPVIRSAPSSPCKPLDTSAKGADASHLALLAPLPLPPVLLIGGAGHVAVPLAQIAHLLGFQVIVQDDRPDFACADRFPGGTVLWAQPIESIVELPPPARLYIALVTRGYQYDLAALQHLRQLLDPSFPRYIGMIGSKRRVQCVWQALQRSTGSSSWFNQLRAPIGLDIGALTPEEIAVSICAELIQVRRGGTGQPLSLGFNPTEWSIVHPPRSIPQSIQVSCFYEDSTWQHHQQQQQS
ncbi:XdhC family protein [Thermocoleostomius sinensis]|uniref:XdhC family protein n=1 Tax=Thermocoleostomius sinensis A174 TaxID=2016057 RepID=A0A9E9C6N4_9CYAN|nr:XdhC/CoxI family protein [Thermocoleostomius sinensis]WAL62446.1 XdhC family protein [Thermocoleostomius sinensis A174]